MEDGPPLRCPHTDDSVTSLPYWDSGAKFPCMYSGTVKTSDTHDHNLFYWMIRNLDSSATPALTIWLNGGPGSSSMFGFFLETGPIRISKDGARNEDFDLTINPDGSWTDVSNVVFLDQPVGTGFSYGSPPVNKMQDGADEFLNFILGLYDLHPDLKDLPLYITGESYAGKYIPIFCQTILNYNDGLSAGDFAIPLTAALIGDPFNAPVT